MTHDPHTFAREHDAVEPLLAEHAFGTLDAGLAPRVDAHLADCAACRATFDEFAASLALLEVDQARRTPGPALAPGARTSLLDAIGSVPQPTAASTSAARRRPWTHAVRRIAPWAVAAAASVACVVVATGSADQDRRINSLEQRLDKARGDQVAAFRGATVSNLDVAGPFGDSRTQIVLKRDAGMVVVRDVPKPPRDMAWHLSTVDAGDRIRPLGVIDSARDLAVLPIEGVDPTDVERIIVTAEPLEQPVDAEAASAPTTA